MGIKQENEITMKVNCGISELCKILEDKGFKVVDRFTMNDIFMIPNTLKSKIKELTSREILKNAILIRDIENQFKENRNKKITFKKKEFNKSGDILSQESINCDIFNIDEAVNFLQAFGCLTYIAVRKSEKGKRVWRFPSRLLRGIRRSQTRMPTGLSRKF